MLDYVKGCFKKYAMFDGRSRRAEYWYFFLFVWLGSSVCTLIDKRFLGFETTDGGPMGAIWALVTILPFLAVGARRLHDINKSGWWQLLWLFIIIGWIWLIVLHCKEGDQGANRFGPDPKNPDALPGGGAIITY